MKKFFKDGNWKEALPLVNYLLCGYLLYEVVNLIYSSDKSIIYQVIMSILVFCFAVEWAFSQANKKE